MLSLKSIIKAVFSSYGEADPQAGYEMIQDGDIADVDENTSFPTNEDIDQINKDVNSLKTSDTQQSGDISDLKTNVKQNTTDIEDLKNNGGGGGGGLALVNAPPDYDNGNNLDTSSLSNPFASIDKDFVFSANVTDALASVTYDTPATDSELDPSTYTYSYGSKVQARILITVSVPTSPSPLIWYYYKFLSQVSSTSGKITKLKVAVINTTDNNKLHVSNTLSINGTLYNAGDSIPFNSALYNSAGLKIEIDYDFKVNLEKISYVDVDGTDYNGAPIQLAIAPTGDWTVKASNGQWVVTRPDGSTGDYILAAYVGKCRVGALYYSNGGSGDPSLSSDHLPSVNYSQCSAAYGSKHEVGYSLNDGFHILSLP